MEPVRAGVYVRISDDREGGGLGVKRQEDDCILLAASLGWRVIDVYIDNDVSAADRRKVRKDYQRMLNDIREGVIDAVIAWHPDRIYRQPRELEDLIDLLEKRGVLVKTVKTGDIDLSTPNGRMTARIHGALAKYEVEHKQERIRRKVQELVAAGKIHNSGHRPFGYTRVFSGEGPRRKIIEDVVNEEEAAHVRKWARRALEGETIYSIVKSANEAGVRSTTGRQWSYQAMRHLLISGRIAGLKEHKREVVGKAVWPAIISEEEHHQLRALLTSKGQPRRTSALKYPLTGLVRCTCSEPAPKMKVRHPSGRKNPQYVCPPKGNGGCGARAVDVPILEDLMRRLLIARLEEVDVPDEDATDDPRPALEQKIAKWERKLEEVKAEFLDGDTSARELREVSETLNARIQQARQEMAQHSAPSRLQVTPEELREEWKDPGFPVGRKQAVFRAFFEEIRVFPAERPFNVFNPDRIKPLWR